MTNYREWFLKNRHKLTHFGISFSGQEMGLSRQEEFLSSQYKVLVCRLSTYHDVSLSFTHGILHNIFSSIEGVFCDLAYLPNKLDADVLKKENIPILLPTITKEHPFSFDILAFSCSLVQEIINLTYLFKGLEIPLNSKDRLDNEKIPLIVIGGASVINLTALFYENSFVDAIFIGEGHNEIKALIETIKNAKLSGKSKREILEILKKDDEVIIPGEKISATKKQVSNFSSSFSSTFTPISLNSSEIDLEISHGCQGWCSFCFENWARKPYKEDCVENLVSRAILLKEKKGALRVNLFSFNFNLYIDLHKLVLKLSEHFNHIGLKSQRVDLLAKNSDSIIYQQKLGKQKFSIGMEGASQRLRIFLNKNIKEEDLLKAIRNLVKQRVREIKVFLISTGTENVDDLNDLSSFLGKLKSSIKSYENKTRIVFSITPLVRFNQTPLEYDPWPSLQEQEKSIKDILFVIDKHKFEARLAADLLEAIFSGAIVRAKDQMVLERLKQVVCEIHDCYFEKTNKKMVELFFKKFPDYNRLLSPLKDQKISCGIKDDFLKKTYENILEKKEIPVNFKHPMIGPKEILAVENKKTFPASIWVNIEVFDGARYLPRYYLAQRFVTEIYRQNSKTLKKILDCVSFYDSLSEVSVFGGDDYFKVSIHQDDFIKTLELVNNLRGKQCDDYFKILGAVDAPILYKVIELEFDNHLVIDELLKNLSLKWTLQKKMGTKEYLLTRDSLKKKMVTSCRIYEMVQGQKAIIGIDEKFNLNQLVLLAKKYQMVARVYSKGSYEH